MDRLDAELELSRLRDAIDRVDEVIVRLLNQRAKYAIEIGEIKPVLGMPVYAPEREKQVLLHVEQTSAGPLDPPTIRRLFERIIDESRRVERQRTTREPVVGKEHVTAPTPHPSLPTPKQENS
ncbi:MAG TPA: chorismate mutase [Rhodanobacteraceae bacterium]|nr:chorismate mutase [Rhodanobacteraceae bacterium]